MREQSEGAPAIVATDAATVALAHVLDRERTTIVGLGGAVRREPQGEPLHDFRVAIRRTRSLLSLAKKDLPGDSWSSWDVEWKWLATLTTDARDLDVVLEDLDSARAVLPGDAKAGLDDVVEAVASKRRAAQEQLRGALATDRYETLTQGWRAALGELALAPRSGVTAKRLGRRLVAKAAKRVGSQAAHVRAEATAEAIHDLRKRTKRLRYAVELFADVLPRSETKAMVKETKRLQDALGAYQDNEVERRVLCSLGEAADLSTAASGALRLLVDRCDRRRQSSQRALSKHVQRLVKATPAFS